MSMDDLKRVQQAGWIIVASDEDGTIARCPSHGCGLKVKIAPGASVQSCDPGLNRAPRDIPVGSHEQVRTMLRDRRRELLLTIAEVEEIAGLTTDHIAKAEKDNPTRVPNLDTVLCWAQALGYEMVLRPAELPPLALRIIDETRRLSDYRRSRHRRQSRPVRTG